MYYDAHEVKKQLTEDDYIDLLDDIGAEPRIKGNVIECLTVCHGGDSHKLICFPDTGQFYCHTSCGTIGDVFALLQQIGECTTFTDAVNWVVRKANVSVEPRGKGSRPKLAERPFILDDVPLPELPDFPEAEKTLSNYPRYRDAAWKAEGIAYEVMDRAGIRLDPIPGEAGILIPHRDLQGRLVGVKERMYDSYEGTTHTYDTKKQGKYRMWRRYAFPTGLNLYGIDKAKQAIHDTGHAIVFEGEKSVLKMRTLLGYDEVCCVASSGSHITPQQLRILQWLGAEEVTLAFDRDWQDEEDQERQRLLDIYAGIAKRYNVVATSEMRITYLFDTEGLLERHDAPIDEGLDTFKRMYKHRLTAGEVLGLGSC